MRLLSAARIADAMADIDPVFLRTPLVRGSALDRVLDVELALKVETLTPIRSLDAAILRAMRLVHEHLGLVVEPAGVAGLAALAVDPARWRGARVAVPLCGGNVTAEDARLWLLP